MAFPERSSCELVELLEEEKKQDREAHARIACLVWATSGFYLYVTTPGVSLLSLSAVAFFMASMFAGSVIGHGCYLVERTIAGVYARSSDFAGSTPAVAIIALGWLLLFLEVVVGYTFAKGAFARITGV